MASKTILLDIGGTFIKCSDGREIPIDSDGTREEIASSLREALSGAEKAAVAIPGPFRYADGTFLMKHKFAAVYGEKFAELVAPEGNCPAVADNKADDPEGNCPAVAENKADAPLGQSPSGAAPCYRFIHDVNCMLLGEMAGGAGKGYGRVALVTLGTGLGFALSLDGEILENELGSPRVIIYNRPFRDGILEDYVSKRGFLQGYPGLTVKELAQRAYESDAAALERFRDRGSILAAGIAPLLQEYGIQCLLFGGQISRSYSLLAQSVEEGLRKVASLQYVGPVSDIGHATFNGLRTLL